MSTKFQEKADELARRTEEKLRAAQWKNIIAPNLDLKGLSDGSLIMVGALLSLTLPNLKDLLEVIDLYAMKGALALLLISGVLGLVAREMHKSITKEIHGNTELGKEIIDAYERYRSELDKLKAEAAGEGETVVDCLNWGALFDPIKKQYPKMMRVVAEEIQARDSDTEKRWRDANKKAGRYSHAALMQAYILAVAIVVMLVFLKEPNRVAMSVNSPGPHTTARTGP